MTAPELIRIALHTAPIGANSRGLAVAENVDDSTVKRQSWEIADGYQRMADVAELRAARNQKTD